jgi:hypothetical protein
MNFLHTGDILVPQATHLNPLDCISETFIPDFKTDITIFKISTTASSDIQQNAIVDVTVGSCRICCIYTFYTNFYMKMWEKLLNIIV